MNEATQIFLDQGLLGAIVFVLAVVVVAQWRENKALQNKLYDEIKETAISAINAQNASSTALNSIADKIQIVRNQ